MGYSKDFVTALEFVWGEGFLSPGGPEEVATLVGAADLRGLRVLDFGSGLGGIDMLLADTHGAAEVVGIDVQPDLIALAEDLARRRGLADRVSFELVTPGPLPFADASFDIVFSKDAMVHVADKQALYAEFLRVLRPGGRLIASDWLWMPGAADDPRVKSWNAGNPLGFVYTTVAEARAALAAAGFRDIETVDRHREIAAQNSADTERLSGPALDDLIALVGEELARDRLTASQARQEVLDSAALAPTHLRASKGV